MVHKNNFATPFGDTTPLFAFFHHSQHLVVKRYDFDINENGILFCRETGLIL